MFSQRWSNSCVPLEKSWALHLYKDKHKETKREEKEQNWYSDENHWDGIIGGNGGEHLEDGYQLTRNWYIEYLQKKWWIQKEK